MKLHHNIYARRLGALALLLCLSCMTAHGAGRRVARIPFEINEGGHIFLRVRVGGSGPLLFGLDSGAEGTLISTEQATALKLKLEGETQAAGGGEGTVAFSASRNVRLGLAEAAVTLPEVGVVPLKIPSPIAGESVAGILGYDLISRFVVEIDYAAQVINLYEPAGYRYRGRGEAIPIRMLDNNPYIPVTVKLPGMAPFRTMFVLDSGANTDLFFFAPFVKRHRLLSSQQETTEASAVGLGGASRIRIGSATSVRVGRTLIPNPVVHFSQATRGDDASNIGAGFVGGKLLRRFSIVIFDQKRRRLILEHGQASGAVL
ncbi:MAG: retropepsin-like domain-containing protein [Acidobacteria bacterium]|nr:retropepsin-like domain-containing protein [Acidobacteriota bacterium]